MVVDEGGRGVDILHGEEMDVQIDGSLLRRRL